MQKALASRKIPHKSIILPELIPFIIPDFKRHSEPITANALSFHKTDTRDWFEEFVATIENKIGKEYFPIMRMSDGEYTFLLGHRFPNKSGLNLTEYIKKTLRTTYQKFFKRSSFVAATLPGVSSGIYTSKEIANQKKRIVEQIKFIAQNGILALHLTYSHKPFQEHFHYPLKKWLDKNEIAINQNNYYPFYFVYALLRGQFKYKVLKNRPVLVLHSATGNKKENIINSLKKEGISTIIWHEISQSRSLFDTIDIKPKYHSAELALIGAGVGKFNVMAQLAPLKIPCIDAGFVFEVWADENNKWKRPMMVPDWEWDESKVLFKE